MIHEKLAVQVEGSLPEACAVTYLLDRSEELQLQKRPVIVICPGGGYRFLSDREGEIIALQYNAMGYHAVVLKYSVAPAVYPTALMELASVVRLIRENADNWNIDTGRLLVSGFSAGGHLAADFGVSWNRDWLARKLHLTASERELLRPDGLILSYPVISAGQYAHEDSFDALLGESGGTCAEASAKLRRELSLETQVNADTPPVFLWHTGEDGCVPVENSLLFVNALRAHGVSVEFHLYPLGGHGLSLADESTASPGGGSIEPSCQSWMQSVRTWIRILDRIKAIQ